ncbi:MAG: AbrB/MazE/SpoVT family DNA-binding domain-containing protein [Gemmobacter sp.]
MTGFADAAEPFGARPTTTVRLKVGPDGRVLIPADLRKAAGIVPGDTVLAELRDGAVEIATFATRIRRVQELLAPYKKPGVSIVDEFIAEKRAMWGEE